MDLGETLWCLAVIKVRTAKTEVCDYKKKWYLSINQL